MHPTEHTKESPQARPRALTGVAMHLPHAVPVVIARPFSVSASSRPCRTVPCPIPSPLTRPYPPHSSVYKVADRTRDPTGTVLWTTARQVAASERSRTK